MNVAINTWLGWSTLQCLTVAGGHRDRASFSIAAIIVSFSRLFGFQLIGIMPPITVDCVDFPYIFWH